MDYGREGQLWKQALAMARQVLTPPGGNPAEVPEEQAVAVVLKRLAHAAVRKKPKPTSAGWTRVPEVNRLEDFLAVFAECGHPPVEPRGSQPGAFHGPPGVDDSGFSEEDITGHGGAR